MKQARNPQSIHAPLANYTHQIEVHNPQRWLTISGQVGMTPAGGVPEEAIEQLKLALVNIKENLTAASMSITDLTKLTFFLVDQIDAPKRVAIIKDFLGDHTPCMTLIYVAGLATPQLKVEIEAVACTV
ncbi:Enamine deaminase RidA, house cleaning of reactive enamine intermediates, YjgF/YER057c/UK114 family [Amphibacillus marinus]|uniref:Enamine deaminase RidA, house cleaning of reactive enamine intermediates, YjgF/YER057c/UK114 family n=1 Tax=Amphibacillus marinus TaxID=872970 RepID=A0A1H8GPE2_9BACI|nr:RidA family protein [Amphibacillus marinus]SEN45991.1 Enamine deaminase RidA, house cleaning of reactive enamine intermediates, YjgF/YER057c/UK114 family [Amphibacillus marinus]